MTPKRIIKLPITICIIFIRGYQRMISPWIGNNCRFAPSCSNYCIEALREHGMVFGLWLGVIRISKCHPFNPGGFDPVPVRKNKFQERD